MNFALIQKIWYLSKELNFASAMVLLAGLDVSGVVNSFSKIATFLPDAYSNYAVAIVAGVLGGIQYGFRAFSTNSAITFNKAKVTPKADIVKAVAAAKVV